MFFSTPRVVVHIWELGNSLTPPGTSPRQHTRSPISILYSQWRLLVRSPPESPVSKGAPGTLWTLIHICWLNEWVNELEKKITESIFVVVYVWWDCLYHTRSPLRIQTPFFQFCTTGTTAGRWLLGGYLGDPLSVPPQPKLISIRCSWAMGSSSVVTPTAHTPWDCGAETLPHSLCHPGAVFETHYLRQSHTWDNCVKMLVGHSSHHLL